MKAEVKQRAIAIIGLGKTVFHWGFIPVVLYLGKLLYYRSRSTVWHAAQMSGSLVALLLVNMLYKLLKCSRTSWLLSDFGNNQIY